jgi:hypothetical protein
MYMYLKINSVTDKSVHGTANARLTVHNADNPSCCLGYRHKLLTYIHTNVLQCSFSVLSLIQTYSVCYEYGKKGYRMGICQYYGQLAC